MPKSMERLWKFGTSFISEEGGQPFIVMRYLEGQTLKHCISGKPLPLDDTLDLAIEIEMSIPTFHPRRRES